jgi:hypothetical protein
LPVKEKRRRRTSFGASKKWYEAAVPVVRIRWDIQHLSSQLLSMIFCFTITMPHDLLSCVSLLLFPCSRRRQE